MAAAASSTTEAGLPRGWSAAQDESGATYYVNDAPGESSWERPVATQQATQGNQEQSLPGGWTAVWSAADNAYYYERDGETTWTLPS